MSMSSRLFGFLVCERSLGLAMYVLRTKTSCSTTMAVPIRGALPPFRTVPLCPEAFVPSHRTSQVTHDVFERDSPTSRELAWVIYVCMVSSLDCCRSDEAWETSSRIVSVKE
ncbi:hypothetical protein C8Q80DRAFT_1186993 [Daedaleopsis nitida]|nr:hypothetical protein C8Q80DRAFT_1186993 [Daedaleopsis nitida]